MGTPCFLVTESENIAMYLRRYRQHRYQMDGDRYAKDAAGMAIEIEKSPCPVHGYHNALKFLGFHADAIVVQPEGSEQAGTWDLKEEFKAQWPFERRDLFPEKCDCGYVFEDRDEVQHFPDRVWYSADGSRFWPQRELPAGAMWYSKQIELWNRHWWDNQVWYDGYALKLPNGSDWYLGSRCSNCPWPDERTHRCWQIEGTPPMLSSVRGGNHCPVGAGSIQSGSYHGFLTNGQLNP